MWAGLWVPRAVQILLFMSVLYKMPCGRKMNHSVRYITIQDGVERSRLFYSQRRKLLCEWSGGSGMQCFEAFLSSHQNKRIGPVIFQYNTYFHNEEGINTCNILMQAPTLIISTRGKNYWLWQTCPQNQTLDVCVMPLLYNEGKFESPELQCAQSNYCNEEKLVNIHSLPTMWQDSCKCCTSSCDKCTQYVDSLCVLGRMKNADRQKSGIIYPTSGIRESHSIYSF